MSKIIYSLLLLCYVSTQLYSQDVIVLVNGKSIPSIILNKNNEEVEIQRYKSRKRSSLRIKTRSIHKITYANGDVKVFNPLDMAKVQERVQIEGNPLDDIPDVAKNNFFQAGDEYFLSFSSSFFGRAYYVNGERVNKDGFMDVLAQDQDAYDLFRSGFTRIGLSRLVGIPAGFALGWQISNLVNNKETNTNVWLASGLLAVVSIMLESGGNEQFRDGLSLFNNEGYSIGLRQTSNGFGWTLNF